MFGKGTETTCLLVTWENICLKEVEQNGVCPERINYYQNAPVRQLGSSVLEYCMCYIQGEYHNMEPWVADNQGNFEHIKCNWIFWRELKSKYMYLLPGQRDNRPTCFFYLVTMPCGRVLLFIICLTYVSQIHFLLWALHPSSLYALK